MSDNAPVSEAKPAMPPQPKTTEIAAVKVPENVLDAVLVEMRAMRAEHMESSLVITDKVDALATTVNHLQHDAKDTRMRIARMEREVDEVKNRQQGTSIRARAVSEENLTQDAAIAKLVTEVADVKKAQETAATERAVTAAVVLEIRDDVSTFFSKHPALAAAIVTLATVAAGSITSCLSARGAH